MDFLPAAWLDEVDSTNRYLRDWLEREPDLPGGAVVAARHQKAGRGQFGRTWLVSAGKDLPVSFLLRAEVDLAWIPSLPMAAALAVTEMLNDCGIAAQVKWPNDVLVGGQKICGILAENVPGTSGACVIIGVGLNVNMSSEDATEVDRPATSMMMLTGREWPLEEVLARLLRSLSAWIDRWHAGGFAAIRSSWIASAVGLGGLAVIQREGMRLAGVLEDFGEHGELVLKHIDGERRLIWSGDLLLDRAANE